MSRYRTFPTDPLARERAAEERVHGYGVRPWDMDVERHRADCWFDGDPEPYKRGSVAFRWVCIGCGAPVFGRTVEACRRHGVEHEEGKR